jgi:hypothetical protein
MGHGFGVSKFSVRGHTRGWPSHSLACVVGGAQISGVRSRAWCVRGQQIVGVDVSLAPLLADPISETQ